MLRFKKILVTICKKYWQPCNEFVLLVSDVADTKFCVRSPQVFFICDTHCTAPQSCYQKLIPHRAAPQIIYLNRKLLDIFFFLKKVFIQTILTVVVIKVSPYISDSIAISYWHNSYWH